MAILSLLGSLFIITSYLRSRGTGLHQYCVFSLSVADVCSSVIFGLSRRPIKNHAFCQIQAFFLQVGLCVPLWTGTIALNFLLQIVFLYKDEDLPNQRIYYFLGTILFPMFTAIYCISLDQMGPTTLWCWIDNDHNLERMLFWYVPVWLTFFCNGICIYFVVLKLREFRQHQMSQNIHSRKIIHLTRQSFGFLMVYFLVWMPATLNRIYQYAHDNQSLYALMYLHSIFVPSQGFLNFLIYTGPIMYKNLKILFRIFILKQEGEVEGVLFSMNMPSWQESDNSKNSVKKQIGYESALSDKDSTYFSPEDLHESGNEMVVLSDKKYLSKSPPSEEKRSPETPRYGGSMTSIPEDEQLPDAAVSPIDVRKEDTSANLEVAITRGKLVQQDSGVLTGSI